MDKNCVFVYSYPEFVRSLDIRLTDGKITRRRLWAALKPISRSLDRITQGNAHRKISIFLRKRGLLKDSPTKYSLEEQASLIPIYERNPGEWRKLLEGKMSSIPEVFHPGGVRKIIEKVLNDELTVNEARNELRKHPSLWKKSIAMYIDENRPRLSREDLKKLNKLTRGLY